MKHKMIKLSVLVLAMNALTASTAKRCVNCVNKINEPIKQTQRDSCSHSVKENTIAKTSKQTTLVKEKKDDNKNLPLTDYRVPLTPFSRFFL